MPNPTNNLEQVELKDFLLSLVDQILIPPETKATENVKVGYDFEYLLKELTKYQHQLTQEARIDELGRLLAEHHGGYPADRTYTNEPFWVITQAYTKDRLKELRQDKGEDTK